MIFSPVPVSKRYRAFSLIEVTLALGILSFGLVVLLGVFSTGLSAGVKSKAEVSASHLASSLLATRRATPTQAITGFPIPPLSTAPDGYQTCWVNEQGTLLAGPQNAFYKLVYAVRQLPGGTAQIYLNLSHPALLSANPLDTSRATMTYEALTYVRLPE